jgi:hypothetical protein
MCQGEVYRFFNKARLEDYEKIRKTAILVEELYRKEIESKRD